MDKYNFYVVFEGHHRGIYRGWDECFPHINDYVKPVYRGFTSYEEASSAYVMWINRWSRPGVQMNEEIYYKPGEDDEDSNKTISTLNVAVAVEQTGLRPRNVTYHSKRRLFNE